MTEVKVHTRTVLAIVEIPIIVNELVEEFEKKDPDYVRREADKRIRANLKAAYPHHKVLNAYVEGNPTASKVKKITDEEFVRMAEKAGIS